MFSKKLSTRKVLDSVWVNFAGSSVKWSTKAELRRKYSVHLLNVAPKYRMCIGYSLYTNPFCMLSQSLCIMYFMY